MRLLRGQDLMNLFRRFALLGVLFSVMPGIAMTFSVTGRSGTFSGEMTLRSQNESYKVWRVVFPSPCPPSYPEGRNVVAWYYEPVPAKRIRGPAVMCMHILSGDGALTMSIAARFAACGLPALMPEMPLFLERIPGGDVEAALLHENGPRWLAESFLAGPGDMLRSADFLASRPSVDANRLRVMGTSLGGILSVTAAGRDPRFEKAAFLLAGGDLKGLFATSRRHEVLPIVRAVERIDDRTRPQIDLAWTILEPTNHVQSLKARVQAGNVRMFNVGSDEVIPLANTKALANALGLRPGRNFKIRPGLGHYSGVAALPDVIDDLAVWFGGRLPPDLHTPESETFRRVFGEINRVLEWKPTRGGDFRVGVQIVVTQGTTERFRQSFVFCRATGGVTGLLRLFVPDSAEPIAVAQTLTARIARRGSLGLLSRFATLHLETGTDGARIVRVKSPFFRGHMELEPTRDVPAALHVQLGRTKLDLKMTEWNTEGLDRK